MHRHIPEAVFLENIGQEITYILPYSGARDGTFALLFKELDLEMGDLGVSTYGISDTTLEEVGDCPWRGPAAVPCKSLRGKEFKSTAENASRNREKTKQSFCSATGHFNTATQMQKT